MDKAKRAKLIRERFTAKAGKWQYVGTGRKVAKEPVKLSRLNSQSFGLALSHRWGRTDWLETADAKPKPTVAPEKRRKGDTPLTRIAAQLPAKLPRVIFDL